jgi:hypothetical protein
MPLRRLAWLIVPPNLARGSRACRADGARRAGGADAQLDKAIEVVLAELAKKPPRPPRFGDYPDKRLKTWVEKYGQTDKP